VKLIYKADNIAEAHIVAGMLKSQGIEAHVGGHYLQGGVGELTTMGFANIHVDDADVEAAKSIISNYENRQPNEEISQNRVKKPSWPYWLLLIILMLAAFFFVISKRYFLVGPVQSELPNVDLKSNSLAAGALRINPAHHSIDYNSGNPLSS